MEWIAILIAAAVVVAGVLAIVAVLAAGAGERLEAGPDVAEAALWAAGFSPREEHLLTTLASVARSETRAVSVEVVLAPRGWATDGIVVTGSRLPPDRVGARVPTGRGTAGRALETGQRALAGGSEGFVAAAVPLGRVPGVVVARGAVPDHLFTAVDVERLEALAAQTGRQLIGQPTRTA